MFVCVCGSLICHDDQRQRFQSVVFILSACVITNANADVACECVHMFLSTDFKMNLFIISKNNTRVY